jgi:peptide/nickel transport system substrate-binding protein
VDLSVRREHPRSAARPCAGARPPAGARVPGWVAALVCIALALAAGLACAPPPAGPPPPLRIGLHSGPVTLDPHLHDEAVTRSILGHLYETLVGFDADMGLVPVLALRWENPNDLTWRFHLRPGVRFHDGRDLTAADVVASLERARRIPGSRSSGYLVAVREVRELDPATIEIVTLRPYPILLNKLAFVAVVPADAPVPITAPIGTAPYRLVHAEPGQGLLLAGFPLHWAGTPAIDRVELRFLASSAARVDALLAGELDVVHEIAASDVPRLAGPVRLEARQGLLVLYLHGRADRPPFADVRVRRAVSLALDREQLVAEMLHGQGTPAGQMLTRQVFGFDPGLPPIARDLAAARQLLADAGYPQGLDLELEMRAGRDAGAVVRQLAEAGIRARVIERPWTEMYPRLASGEVTFYLGGWACSSGDASDLFDSMLHRPDPAGGYGDSNFSGFHDPVLDGLIEASGATLDMASRQRVLRQALRLTAEQLPVIPLAVPHALYGVRREVAWSPRLDSRVYAFEMRRHEPAAASRPGGREG